IPDIRNMRPDLPDITQSVISSALAKSAEARYPTPSALASALAYALEAATKELRDVPSTSHNALLMTNMLGQIIFIDHHCLRLMKRSDSDVRHIIGKPLHEILGLMPKVVEGLVKDVAKNGRASIPQVNLKDALGNVIQVSCSAV